MHVTPMNTETSSEPSRTLDDALRETLEALDAPAMVLDDAGRIVLFNDVALEVFDLRRDEALGRPYWDVLLSEHRARRARRLFGDGDFQRIPATQVMKCETGRGERRRLRWSNTMIRDNDGDCAFIVATGTDLTPSSEEPDSSGASLHALGLPKPLLSMLSSMTHEVRNPLNVAGLYLDLLQRQFGTGFPADDADSADQFAEMIDTIRQQVDRASDTLQEFSDYTRCLPLQTSRQDLVQTLRGVVDALNAETDAPSPVIECTAPERLPAEFDAPKLRQSLRHLLSRALDMARRPPLALTLEAPEPDQTDAPIRLTTLSPGATLLDDPDELFAPFSASKKSQSGIGLAYARQVVEAHGGRATASPTDEGVQWQIELPS